MEVSAVINVRFDWQPAAVCYRTAFACLSRPALGQRNALKPQMPNGKIVGFPSGFV